MFIYCDSCGCEREQLDAYSVKQTPLVADCQLLAPLVPSVSAAPEDQERLSVKQIQDATRIQLDVLKMRVPRLRAILETCSTILGSTGESVDDTPWVPDETANCSCRHCSCGDEPPHDSYTIAATRLITNEIFLSLFLRDAPNKAEIFSIKKILHETQIELDQTNIRIPILRTVVTDCEVILSHIRRIPNEVLCEIFKSCFDDSLADQGWGQVTRLSRRDSKTIAPWSLSYVSRRWRTTALSCQALWVDIHVVLNPQRLADPTSATWLRDRIARAGRRPLNNAANDQILHNLGQSHPLLERLSIDGLVLTKGIETFSDAPLLTKLRVAPQNVRHLRIPFSQIQDLRVVTKGGVPVGGVLAFLPRLKTMITDCDHLHHGGGNHNFLLGPGFPNGTTTHRALESLTLTTCKSDHRIHHNPFMWLILPGLTTLHMVFSNTNLHVRSISSLIERSGCIIMTFTITAGAWDKVDLEDLVALLDSMPSLRNISLLSTTEQLPPKSLWEQLHQSTWLPELGSLTVPADSAKEVQTVLEQMSKAINNQRHVEVMIA
ncbi:hypothetical protein C8J56DRAFT_1171976 [Mycena floridula]|nr:hypothetical protein C8J56DRAFT_1171976 [Mycena floridula]